MELDTDYIREHANTSDYIKEHANAALEIDALSDASITVIDPQGDLVLNIGDISLLVSSKVLSVASPVFRTMLGPNFREGEKLSQRLVCRNLGPPRTQTTAADTQQKAYLAKGR